jgi:two-component system phosphate regulon sensor histidine kinase PhoR
MRPIRIIWKQFFYFFLIIIFTFFLLVFFTSRKIKSHYIASLESTLEHEADLIEKLVSDFVASGNAEEIDRLTKELGKEIDVRITVVGKDGFVLGDSKEDPSKMENHAYRAEIRQALQGEVGKSTRYSSTVKEEMLYVAVPVMDQGKVVGVVRTSLSLKKIEESMGAINQQIIYLAVGLMALALLLSLLFSKTLTRPIKEMALTAGKIKDGDFEARVSIKSKDEVGELSNALNEMARELQNLFPRLNSEREELKGIISAMVEGLVVLDRHGKIVLSNQSFTNMLGVSSTASIVGKRYWEFLQSLDFNDLVKSVSAENIPRSREIGIGGKTFWANGIAVSKEDDQKLIVVLHDITELKRLEKMKADFVANVAHELKTPLTAIKGFVETLEDESHLEKPHLAIIKRNVERLTYIVSDLLLLSKLESKEQKLQIEEVNLARMVENLLKIFEKQLQQKGIELKLSVPENLRIKADPFWLEQIFINLLDNAIKFTEGGQIGIDISSENENIKIKIQDTGMGIPKEDLPRIFERFFVGDKSRSRKVSGTGLGLPIVKHAVLAHNGKIDVESKIGEGSKFIITLPTNPLS